jgi:hypothetical protein
MHRHCVVTGSSVPGSIWARLKPHTFASVAMAMETNRTVPSPALILQREALQQQWRTMGRAGWGRQGSKWRGAWWSSIWDGTSVHSSVYRNCYPTHSLHKGEQGGGSGWAHLPFLLLISSIHPPSWLTITPLRTRTHTVIIIVIKQTPPAHLHTQRIQKWKATTVRVRTCTSTCCRCLAGTSCHVQTSNGTSRAPHNSSLQCLRGRRTPDPTLHSGPTHVFYAHFSQSYAFWINFPVDHLSSNRYKPNLRGFGRYSSGKEIATCQYVYPINSREPEANMSIYQCFLGFMGL